MGSRRYLPRCIEWFGLSQLLPSPNSLLTSRLFFSMYSRFCSIIGYGCIRTWPLPGRYLPLLSDSITEVLVRTEAGCLIGLFKKIFMKLAYFLSWRRWRWLLGRRPPNTARNRRLPYSEFNGSERYLKGFLAVYVGVVSDNMSTLRLLWLLVGWRLSLGLIR